MHKYVIFIINYNSYYCYYYLLKGFTSVLEVIVTELVTLV